MAHYFFEYSAYDEQKNARLFSWQTDEFAVCQEKNRASFYSLMRLNIQKR